MPEVSLVAILDADKPGFLRSERSLVQTIGRASRNEKGRAILYGDKITPAMDYAINETKRRRQKQIEHNLKHGITPTTVIRKIHDLKEGFVESTKTDNKPIFKVAEDHPGYDTNNPKQLSKLIAKLEKQMFEHAHNMEFEEAANLRDEIARIKSSLFVSS